MLTTYQHAGILCAHTPDGTAVQAQSVLFVYPLAYVLPHACGPDILQELLFHKGGLLSSGSRAKPAWNMTMG